MRPFATQLDRVLAAATPLPPVTLPIASTRGLVLAESVFSRVALPGFANSAMDGYAVRRADLTNTPVTLRVVADVPAGSSLDPELRPGQCARVMTGAPVPSGADAVVPFERTNLGTAVTATAPEQITVLAMPTPQANIRAAGEDIQHGDLVAAAGEVVGARTIAALAAAGVAEVSVHPRPRVAVVSTGNELVPAGARPLRRGEIYDSNLPMLRALVAAAGGELAGEYHADDDGAGFTSLLHEAEQHAEIIVTTGGVSVGAFDVVRLELERSTWQVEFVKVAMQPGKPQGFGRAPSGALVFALPGNPVSAFVSFTAFVQPAMRRLAGLTDEPHRASRATARKGWRTPPGRMQFMPVRWHDGGVVPAHARGSGSHLIARLAGAEALALVPAEVEEVFPGDELTIWEVLA